MNFQTNQVLKSWRKKKNNKIPDIKKENGRGLNVSKRSMCHPKFEMLRGLNGQGSECLTPARYKTYREPQSKRLLTGRGPGTSTLIPCTFSGRAERK